MRWPCHGKSEVGVQTQIAFCKLANSKNYAIQTTNLHCNNSNRIYTGAKHSQRYKHARVQWMLTVHSFTTQNSLLAFEFCFPPMLASPESHPKEM